MSKPVVTLLHRFSQFLLLALAAISLCGCSQCSSSDSESEVGHKPISRGLPYELVVIVPRAAYEGELADTLNQVLRSSTPILPQHEPLFRLDVTYADANLTPWRTFRNRLIIKINRQLHQPEMGVARNIVARPQIEVMVSGPTTHAIAQFIGDKREQLTDLFVDAELEWQAAQLRRKHSQMTSDALHELCGHTICVPQNLRASKRGRDFLWTGTNLNDRDQNFVYYAYAWDGRPLSLSQFVAKRDSALRANIPGATANQWMQTAMNPDTREPLVMARARTLYNCTVLEARGLWEVHNGALGGPFVAIERVDTAARRVIVTEGFVYSPHSPKRTIMREMEASLRTFR